MKKNTKTLDLKILTKDYFYAIILHLIDFFSIKKDITMLGFFIILTIVFVLTAIFFGVLYSRKIQPVMSFIENSKQIMSWYHPCGETREPNMYNIVIKGREPFVVLIRVQSCIPLLSYLGFDKYIFIKSDSDSITVLYTYMGKAMSEFHFFVHSKYEVNPITITSSDDDQQLSPDVIYPPRWYQRLGFYS
ncbi:MAG: hypothetical protein WC025_02150 [Candidatus Magasanikbacteria bacterium]